MAKIVTEIKIIITASMRITHQDLGLGVQVEAQEQIQQTFKKEISTRI